MREPVLQGWLIKRPVGLGEQSKSPRRFSATPFRLDAVTPRGSNKRRLIRLLQAEIQWCEEPELQPRGSLPLISGETKVAAERPGVITVTTGKRSLVLIGDGAASASLELPDSQGIQEIEKWTIAIEGLLSAQASPDEQITIPLPPDTTSKHATVPAGVLLDRRLSAEEKADLEAEIDMAAAHEEAEVTASRDAAEKVGMAGSRVAVEEMGMANTSLRGRGAKEMTPSYPVARELLGEPSADLISQRAGGPNPASKYLEQPHVGPAVGPPEMIQIPEDDATGRDVVSLLACWLP